MFSSMKPSTPKQCYLILVVARFEWREYQCQYIIIHFHEMHLVIQFKRAFYSCQWKYKMSQFNQWISLVSSLLVLFWGCGGGRHCPSSSLEQVHGQQLASTPRHSTRASPPPFVGCSAALAHPRMVWARCDSVTYSRCLSLLIICGQTAGNLNYQEIW